MRPRLFAPCSQRARTRAGSAGASSLPAMEAALMAWFRENGRDLPWRRTRDPYAILVSEVMLQQTHIFFVDLGSLQGFRV